MLEKLLGEGGSWKPSEVIQQGGFNKEGAVEGLNDPEELGEKRTEK